MCGRAYSTYTEDELRARYLNLHVPDLIKLKPNFNVAPSQEMPVVLSKSGSGFQLDLLKWGLVPYWATDPKVGYKMINARAETIAEKPSFRRAFSERRCVVPLSGFYEWRRQGDSKQPFEIHRQGSPILSVAGIWEAWRSAENEPWLRTFSLITCAPNRLMSAVHDRMPVILDEKAESIWLDSSQKNPSALQELLKPCPDSWLEGHEVSSLVNSVKNNRPELLRPVGEVL